jgi:hypothetical protein
MPRNYDEMRAAEDHTFIIRGESFTINRMRPEVMGEIEALEKDFTESEKTTYQDVVNFAESRLKLLLDDQNGAVDRWDALRAKEEDPVTYGEIMDLSRWAVETITGLPTMPPAPSAPGRGKTAASSKAA